MTDGGGGSFAARLRSCRLSAGLSQQELAERSGLSVRAIGGLERGRTRWPYQDSLHRLADALRLREAARTEFIAAAGRRLAPNASAVVAEHTTGAARQPAAGRVVPRQLPATVAYFTGRAGELAALARMLDQAGGDAPGTVVISAIGGTPGVGKTALAIHWAHQVAQRYPDGQLYVNLRGFGPPGQPVPAAEVIRAFLDALGVAPERIPPSLDAQAGLYRSLLADQRMLVVLDNACDAGQVRPLLPGSGGSLVIVTSRSQLAGLAVSDGAHLITLDVPAAPEARQMLTARLGTGRAAAEPEAIAEITDLCACLPLALAIAAARAAARPSLPLATLAAELRDAASRLDALDAGDPAASVRAVFSWSVRQLSLAAARMFRLLGLHPGPDISALGAASLAGVPLAQARQNLGELSRAHLLTEHRSGRYTYHDLLRAYAADQARAADSGPEREAAIGRLLDHYLHTAHTAALLIHPAREPITVAQARPGITPEQLTSEQQALAWFGAEQHVLLVAVTLAAETGFDVHAWQISWTMWDFLDWQGDWQRWSGVLHTALDAATRLGDLTAQATGRRLLASACARLESYDEARAHLAACLELCQQHHDAVGQARAHASLSFVADRQGCFADALDHAEQALGIFQATGRQGAQAEMLNAVGWCHAQLGNYEQARSFCQEALALHRELGDRGREAHTWDSLGYAEHHLGHHDQAATCYTRAHSIFTELGDRYYQATILTHLGDSYHAAGQPQRTRDAWQQALAILGDLSHPDVGQVCAKLRELDAAELTGNP
jgi:tetratricopeptide (TPR) repeat protein/transcriptional regulator with XRE-family HTH domain